MTTIFANFHDPDGVGADVLIARSIVASKRANDKISALIEAGRSVAMRFDAATLRTLVTQGRLSPNDARVLLWLSNAIAEFDSAG